ncbi:cytochrome aa3 quinol oxidase subunit II [Bacillus lacus]|uniref:Quinol oxidase subunit 2 n=2 Tax=Metabacillus lacus TaxID=1983721 RepID=A0A7X2IWW7_9BACI|nr:cytochrome aa3 quinol oxidase subunit II [Metabacillus lacus]MRX71174.1 cytochrome aa3 quinol oxidase subunit II [Metabacillus lacus]
MLSMVLSVFLLGGCSSMAVLDPKGPVAAQQKDLIMLSIYFMLFIVIVVFVLFTFIVFKYRERPDNMAYEPPEMEGSKILEIVWTVIPVIIVIALSIPTVQVIYSLEGPPKETAHKEPLVVHATSVDWKWVFSYPEENIETVNYLNIPTERPILFRLTSADAMAALWIPQLGGQKYNMSGMETQLYLQADEPGVYQGRNANFTGQGFSGQRFEVTAKPEDEFEAWVEETQATAPELTEDQYELFMLPGETGLHTFSSTHLDFVDHAHDAEYAMNARDKHGVHVDPHGKGKDEDRTDMDDIKTREEHDRHENSEEGDHEHSH